MTDGFDSTLTANPSGENANNTHTMRHSYGFDDFLSKSLHARAHAHDRPPRQPVNPSDPSVEARALQVGIGTIGASEEKRLRRFNERCTERYETALARFSQPLSTRDALGYGRRYAGGTPWRNGLLNRCIPLENKAIAHRRTFPNRPATHGSPMKQGVSRTGSSGQCGGSPAFPGVHALADRRSLSSPGEATHRGGGRKCGAGTIDPWDTRAVFRIGPPPGSPFVRRCVESRGGWVSNFREKLTAELAPALLGGGP